MSNHLDTAIDKLTLKEQSYSYLLFAHLFMGNIKVLKGILDGEEISPSSSQNEFQKDLSHLIQSLKEIPARELKILYENLFLIPGAFYVPPYGAHFLYGKNDDVSTTDFLENIALEYETEGYLNYAENTYLRLDHLGVIFMYLHFLLEKVDKSDRDSIDL